MNYKIIKRSFPVRNGTRRVKWYGSFRHNGRTSFKELLQKMEKQGMSQGDIYQALYIFQTTLLEELQQGHTVNWDGMGTFQVSVKATPADDQHSFTVRNIRQVTIRFHPCKKLTRLMAGIPIRRR